MTDPIRVCSVTDLDHDRPRCYRVAGVDVFVVRHWDKVYALENRCGHAGAALHRGVFTDGLIVCPLHGAAFRVESGAVEWTAILPPPMSEYAHSENPRLREFGELMEGVETLPIRRFAVEIVGDEVFIIQAADQMSSMP
jgi:nitrite reductase/ring-hydroxylating ferredoxin subunit